MQGNLGMKFNK